VIEDTLLPAVLVEVVRGKGRESLHRGDAAVVDAAGKLLFRLGNPYRMAFMRSAAKPFHALTVLETGAAARYGFTPPEIAVMCGSHSGERQHLEAVSSILRKVGLETDALACGVHPPLDATAARELERAGERPGPLHNNCSGKHAGMLAACRHLGWPTQGYLDPEHPLQVRNRGNLALFAGMAPEDLEVAVDGCGAPVWAMPLASMARAYARLAQPAELPEAIGRAARAVTGAMQAHPELVAGTGRLCTRLMQVAGGKLVSKSGAEGVYCVGTVGQGWGLALKIEDGSARAVPPAVIELLQQIGALDGHETSLMADLHRPRVLDHRGEPCGAIRATGRLEPAG